VKRLIKRVRRLFYGHVDWICKQSPTFRDLSGLYELFGVDVPSRSGVFTRLNDVDQRDFRRLNRSSARH
jgi:hypothetical protein